MKTGVVIINAEYIDGYKVRLTFSDGTINVVDFEKIVASIEIPEYEIYKDFEEFKKFKIEVGNIVWGKDWDLIFPIHKLYNNNLDAKAVRKKSIDKKL